MARIKTYPQTEQMWYKTISYLYFLHATRWFEWNHWLCGYEAQIKWHGAPTLAISELEALWRTERAFGPLVQKNHGLCIVKKSHRLLLAGDVFIALINNFQRFPVFGVSSKGAKLNHYWLSEENAKYKGLIEIVELPGDFISRRWDDPAIRQFVVDLCASSRSWVGAGSPAP